MDEQRLPLLNSRLSGGSASSSDSSFSPLGTDIHRSSSTSIEGGDNSNSVSPNSSPPLGLEELDLYEVRTRKESILDELLSDIRRSCANSSASTPTSSTAVLSEGERDGVFDCRMFQSEAEMRTLGVLDFSPRHILPVN